MAGICIVAGGSLSLRENVASCWSFVAELFVGKATLEVARNHERVAFGGIGTF